MARALQIRRRQDGGSVTGYVALREAARLRLRRALPSGDVRAVEPALPSGKVFDTLAAEYDRHRPAYPGELVEQACAELAPGDPVLEVGCGTGQLTRALAARGLQITAVDPGRRLLKLAGDHVVGVQFVHAPFESVQLSTGQFRGVFSASAFHWVDPDVSWARAADALAPGGVLALLQYCGVRADDDDQDTLMATLRRFAPQIAAGWPRLRPLKGILAGIEERAANVSQVWSWVAQRDLDRPSGRLFHDVQGAAVAIVREDTADALVALMRTLSPYRGMTAKQRAAIEASIVSFAGELGRPIRSTVAAVLVTARKVGG